MCGVAGVIHRGGTADIGLEMTSMLQSLKHRGPDSTGFAIYGQPNLDEYIMRFKVAEQEDLESGFRIHQEIRGASGTATSTRPWRPASRSRNCP